MNSATIPHVFSIKGSNNRLMMTDVVINIGQEKSRPVIIFCHGYKGFKDWGCWDLVGEEFSRAGFNFIKFNFSHNGVTLDTPSDFSDLEAFGNNNYTKELFDVTSVIDWVCSQHEFSDYFDLDSLFLVGHSRGGGIASLVTAKDTRVKKTVTWASVYSLLDRLPKNVEEWKEKGVVYQLNGRTHQEMPLFYQFYENTELNREELDIEKWGRKIRSPFCIIHGADDKVVTQEEADRLNELIPTSQLILLERAEHTFGCSHPWLKSELPDEMFQVVKESVNFLLR